MTEEEEGKPKGGGPKFGKRNTYTLAGAGASHEGSCEKRVKKERRVKIARLIGSTKAIGYLHAIYCERGSTDNPVLVLGEQLMPVFV